MSEDDISHLSCQLVDEEYVKFKAWIIDQASQEQSELLFTERYANVDITLTYLLEIYEAGRTNTIPDAWIPLYRQMKRTQQKEYLTYLRLKAKYEGHHSVSEITTGKASNPLSPQVDEQPAQKRAKKKTPTPPFRKDKGITSFY